MGLIDEVNGKDSEPIEELVMGVTVMAFGEDVDTDLYVPYSRIGEGLPVEGWKKS